MTQHRSRFVHEIDIRIGQPRAVSDRDLGPEKPQLVEVCQRRHSPAPGAVHFLVNSFLDVDVDTGLVLLTERLYIVQHRVRAPVHVMCADKDVDPVRLIAFNQLIRQSQVIFRGDRTEGKYIVDLSDERRGKCV